MRRFAGFDYKLVQSRKAGGRPLVFLHGSGQDEDSLRAFGQKIGSYFPLYFVRGQVVCGAKYAFLKRNADRSVDEVDLFQRAESFCDFLKSITIDSAERPVLVGYSNGAILAAEIIRQDPKLVSGAILLRPQSPSMSGTYAQAGRLPVLLLGGMHDTRREPTDVLKLESQLVGGGADVSTYQLNTGHDWSPSGEDMEYAKTWLNEHFAIA